MKKHDKIAIRLAIILNKLNSNEKFSIEDLIEEFNVTKRTIQRDLNERLSYLPIKKEDNLYSLEEYYLGKLNFKDIKTFATLSGIKELYPSLDEEFLKSILDDTVSRAYIIRGHDYEDISSRKNDFKILEKAILEQKQISFIYKDLQRVLSPYKLLNKYGIWYLIGLEDNLNLKTFSFNKTNKIQLLENTFEVDEEILKIILNDDNTWFSKKRNEVILKVNSSVSNYFKRRKILPNQSILKELENGSLLVLCNISFDEEILKIIRYWIPNIEIISPESLNEKLYSSLKEYIKKKSNEA